MQQVSFWAVPKDPTHVYAEAVLSGDIIAGKFVRLACERHIRDLQYGPKRGIYFDEEEAARVFRFFPAVFTITAGEKEGEPFHLLQWMEFVVGSLFGWRDRSGRRRFRQAWIETGKGQAKSPLMGALGIYLMGFCGIRRAECYAIANDKDQAKVLFSDAVALCRANIPERGEETLEARGDVIIRGIGDNAWKIEHPASQSKFLPVASSDAISGPKPVAVFGDEIHEMKTNRAIELWKSAIDKMPGDPLMVLGTNTPASDQAVATDYSEFYQKVLEGQIEDDSAFAYIARVDEEDEPFRDESCWVKSLPALGITFPVENIRKRVQTSKALASTRISTERLYFGIPVGSAGFWIDEASWRSCQGEVDENEFEAQSCFLSLDLSEKNDLTSLSACWTDGEKRAVKNWYWTTAQNLEEREAADHVPYASYAADGHLSIHQGAVIDYTFVAAKVAELVAAQKVEALIVDPAYLSKFMEACEEVGLAVWLYEGEDGPEGAGLKILKHGQGTRIIFTGQQLCMPHSITFLEDQILEGSIVIENNKMTDVCASNAVIVTDGMGNKAFTKQRSRGRIDGMVSIAMAVGGSAARTKSSGSYMAGGVIFT